MRMNFSTFIPEKKNRKGCSIRFIVIILVYFLVLVFFTKCINKDTYMYKQVYKFYNQQSTLYLHRFLFDLSGGVNCFPLFLFFYVYLMSYPYNDITGRELSRKMWKQIAFFPISHSYKNKNVPEIKHLPQSEEFFNLNDLTCWRGNIVKGNKNMQMIRTRPFSARNLCFSVKGQLYTGTIFL